MKKTYLFFIFFQFSIISFGQTKVDNFLTVKFPCKVVKKDTVFSNTRILAYYCNDASHSLQRILADNTQNNYNGLKEFYLGTEKGFSKSIAEKGYTLQSSEIFKIDKYFGLQATYYDSKKSSKVLECRFIVLNEYLYTLIYFNKNFDEKNKNDFLNSMKIDLAKKPKQSIIKRK